MRLRTRVTKGAGSKKAALAMAYKLLDAAQDRWRRFNGHELVADVLDGATFADGERITDQDTNEDEMTDERVAASSFTRLSTTLDNCSVIYDVEAGAYTPIGSTGIATGGLTVGMQLAAMIDARTS